MPTEKGLFSELIDAHCQDPDKPDLIMYSGEILTYGELIRLRGQIQTTLMDWVRPWERVALITRDGRLCMPLLLGVMETAICAPLDPALNNGQYRSQLELLRIDWVLCDRDLDAVIESALDLGLGIITLPGGPVPAPETSDLHLQREPDAARRPEQGDSRPAFVFTTSGTTSQPKVVPMLYAGLARAIEVEADFYDYTAESVQLVAVQLFRNPAIQVILKVLIRNGSIVYTDGVNPKRIADCLQRFPITHMNLQPAGMFALLRYCQQSSYVYPHQHNMYLIVVGAPLPVQVREEIQQLFHANLIDHYGMTEVGLITSPHKAPKGYKPGSVGCPFFKQIRLEEGEVLVKDFGMFAGYDDPEVNRDSFLDDWFRTGDMASIDEDGYLFLQGRVREMINRGGEKISPYEVEAALLESAPIKEAVAFPYPNKQGSDDVGVVVVPHPGATVDLREIRSALRSRIKPYKLPALLYSVAEIPTSSAHKVQRNLLCQQLQALGLTPQTLKNEPRDEEEDLTPTQAVLRELWQYILDQPYIGLDDDFFDLGGDSLSAAELLSAIETRLDCVLPVNDFFRQSTVRELAQLVDATPRTGLYRHLAPIRPQGGKIPVFLVHDVHGDVVTYHHLAAHIDPERPVYGLNLNFAREAWNTAATLADIAAVYAEEVRRLAPAGPYYLGGLSIGGAIALEMARILEQQAQAAVVVMLDTYSQSYVHKSRKSGAHLRSLLRYSIKTIRQTPAAEVPRLVHSKLAPARNVLMNVLQTPSFDQQPQKLDVELNDPTLPELQRNKMLLSHLNQTYQPQYYNGQVYYFEAARRSDQRDYWRSRVREFVVIPKDCNHTDFVEPEYAGDTARDINAILARHDAEAYHNSARIGGEQR